MDLEKEWSVRLECLAFRERLKRIPAQFMQDYERHRFYRKMIRRGFTQNAVKHLMKTL